MTSVARNINKTSIHPSQSQSTTDSTVLCARLGLAYQVGHVGLRLGELHLVHALARVPAGRRREGRQEGACI